MNKKLINIIHWDDDSTMETFIEGVVKFTLRDYGYEVRNGFFLTDPDIFLSRLRSENFDLVILDIENGDGEPHKGFELLNEIITTYKNSIPFLIFSRHSNFIENVMEFQKKYDLKIKFLNKSKRGTPEYRENVKLDLEFLLDLNNSSVTISAENDFKTLAAVNTIGLDNLQKIIGTYKGTKTFITDDNVSIKAITPGLSGAFVLEVKFKNISKLLKISHDKEKILLEYNNLEKYAVYLPSAIKLDYENVDPNKFSADGWYCIFYEFVEYSTTFFDFLHKNVDDTIIENILSDLFSSSRLVKLYKNKQEYDIAVNENVCEDLNPTRNSFISNAINYLSPILNEHAEYFNIGTIESLLQHKSYKDISALKISSPKSSKMLSHADLHSDNILVDGRGRPIVIDPGNLSYKHWAFDISRLIVDLCLRGINYNSIEYFDTNSIESEYTVIIKNVIQKNSVPIMQGSKSGFIVAINWLIEHLETIFSDDYSLWEYQLSLTVEFIKASYKNAILPPNKRALALIAACIALEESNISFKQR
jgi:hypothetical protein